MAAIDTFPLKNTWLTNFHSITIETTALKIKKIDNTKCCKFGMALSSEIKKWLKQLKSLKGIAYNEFQGNLNLDY